MAALEFLCSSLFVTVVWSQTTICVWKSVNQWDHINGVYTKQNDTWNTQSYWERSSSSCPDTTYYIFASWYNPDTAYYWLIHPSLVTDYQLGFPDCETQPLTGNPTICSTGYVEWYSGTNNWDLPLTVTNGSCPSLKCEKIELTGITTPSQTVCNTIFTRNTQYDNVFVNNDNDTIYLYFNQYTFKWYCSATLSIDDCHNDTDITHQYISSLSDQWLDVTIGNYFTITMSNNEDATFQCLGEATTSIPTSIPSSIPTSIPSIPTSIPTLIPTLIPTDNATSTENTINTSNNPTDITTLITTSIKSNIPTDSSNPTQTSSPSNTPVQDVTNSTTVSETITTTMHIESTTDSSNNPINTPLPTVSPLESTQSTIDTKRKRVSLRPAQKLQMTSTEHVDTTALAIAIVIIGGFCMVVTIVSCVLWRKHEKAYRPIYQKRKEQMLADIQSDKNDGLKGQSIVSYNKKKRDTFTLHQYEVEVRDLKPGAMYEAEDGSVQFAAL